jgi:anti-sigma-K factor RskA
MIDERQQELASLYALGLLESAELATFEAELQKNAELQKLVRELRETSAAYALSAAQASPSPQLKSRVLARIDAAQQPAVNPTGKLVAFRPAVLIPWAIAAGLAVACVWLAQLHLQNQTEKAVLQDQLQLADLEVKSRRQQLEAERILSSRQVADATDQVNQLTKELAQTNERMTDSSHALAETSRQLETAKTELLARQTKLADVSEKLAAANSEVSTLRERMRAEGDLAQFKIATLASLAGNSPQALAVAVWNPTTQRGVLRVEKLPALASDKDYQLWLIDPAYPGPTDAGVFTVDPATGHAQVTFKPNQRVNNAAKFAVSLERKGGAPKPEGPILLLGD